MKGYITADDIANDIRMNRSLHKGVFLIVEGSNDSLALQSFVDQDACHVSVALGKENAIGAARILNGDNFLGFLAIVDADFDCILGNMIEEENVLVTDLHDLDCMLLDSPAFDRVLAELGSAERIQIFSKKHGPLVANILAKKAEPLGCMLLVSLKEEFNLTFNELSFSKFIDQDTLKCNVPSMIQHVLNKSQEYGLDKEVLKSSITTELDAGHELWQVVRGHDVVQVLSIALRKVLAARNASDVTPEKLEQWLRIAYNKDYFRATTLASSIDDWESEHPNYRVLLRD